MKSAYIIAFTLATAASFCILVIHHLQTNSNLALISIDNGVAKLITDQSKDLANGAVVTAQCAPFYLHCNQFYGDTGDQVEKNIKEYWDKFMINAYLDDKLNNENLDKIYPTGYVYHHHYYHHHYGQDFYRNYNHHVSHEHRRGHHRWPWSPPWKSGDYYAPKIDDAHHHHYHPHPPDCCTVGACPCDHWTTIGHHRGRDVSKDPGWHDRAHGKHDSHEEYHHHRAARARRVSLRGAPSSVPGRPAALTRRPPTRKPAAGRRPAEKRGEDARAARADLNSYFDSLGRGPAAAAAASETAAAPKPFATLSLAAEPPGGGDYGAHGGRHGLGHGGDESDGLGHYHVYGRGERRCWNPWGWTGLCPLRLRPSARPPSRIQAICVSGWLYL
jgi:hypothetical protein